MSQIQPKYLKVAREERVIASLTDYKPFEHALKQQDDEKQLVKVVVKIRKISRSDPPLVMSIDLLMGLLEHHNVNILVGILAILANMAPFKPIPMARIILLINHDDFRVQQGCWVVIQHAMHQASVRAELEQSNLLGLAMTCLSLSSQAVKKSTLEALECYAMYFEIPKDMFPILDSHFLSSNETDLVSATLSVMAFAIKDHQTAIFCTHNKLIEQVHACLKHVDTTRSALKCLVSLTAHLDQKSIQSIINTDILVILGMLFLEHKDLISKILFNIGLHAQFIDKIHPFASKLTIEDYELFCVYSLYPKYIPIVARTAIRAFSHHLDDPVVLESLLRILESTNKRLHNSLSR